jgi:hypothetical protein
MSRRIALVLLLASVGVAAHAEDWPQFRGPTGQGHSSERGLPVEWGESRNVLWKTPVAGRGWSSPVVAGSRVWLTTSLKDRMQIAPAELEAVLLGHPSIADAAVIPLADEEAGEVPKAFVVLKGELTSADILAYVAARVAPYKKLRSVEVTDHIPRSPSGKILRRILVERQSATQVTD